MRKRKLFRCGSFSLIDLVAYLTMVRECELTICGLRSSDYSFPASFVSVGG